MKSILFAFLAAVLSLVAFSSTADAQTVTYTTTGLLNVVSGPDKLGLGGQVITVTNSLQENQSPISGSTYSTTITISYGGTTIQNQPATVTINYSAVNATTNNIALSGTITEFGLVIATTSTVYVPGIPGTKPSPIPSTPLTTSDQLTLSGNGSETIYAFANGTISSSPGVANCTTTSVTPNPLTVPGPGGTVTVTATSSPSPCATTSSSQSSWLTVAPTGGLGSGPFSVTAQSNNTGSARTGSITIGGQVISVTQGLPIVCSYTVSPLNLTFNGTGGALPVSVTASDASCSWTTSSNAPWLTVVPGSSSGSGTATVTAAANSGSSARTGSVVIAGQTVAVSQNPPIVCNYTVSPLTLLLDSVGGSQTLSVTASDPSCVWTAVSSAFWITVPTGGTGSGTLSVTVANNGTGVTRSGTVTVAGMAVSVTQSAIVGCAFSVTPTSLSFTAEGGTLPLSLLASAPTCNWTASSTSWISLSSYSGIGPGTVQVTVASSTGTRTGTLVLAGQTISVTEAAPLPCTYSTSPASLAYDSNGGSASVTVTANYSYCQWTSAADSSWISPGAAGGTGTGQATFTISSNGTGVDRNGNLLVAGSTIPLFQAFTVQQFSDVPPTAYYFDAVNLLAAKGITEGCSADEFCPMSDITRAQTAIFIVRAVYGSDNFTYSQTPYFADVPTGSFGFQWIQKMFELGITTGCGNGDFCPNDNITRDQMSVFLIRARLGATTQFTYPPTPYFTDVPSSYWAFSWIQRMKLDQITSGCTSGQFCPANPVTRGDMAIFVMRGEFNELLPVGTPVITQVSPNILTQGQQNVSVTVTGQSTNFVQGTTTMTAVPGVTIGTITVNSPTLLTVILSADPSALQQPEPVLVVTGSEQAVLPNGLVIQ